MLNGDKLKKREIGIKIIQLNYIPHIVCTIFAKYLF